MDDETLRSILADFRLSWRGYRKVRKGVKKRLVRHLTQLGCRSVDDYLRKLAEDPELKKQAEQNLTVTISRFFRDRRLWQDLHDHVMPNLMKRPLRNLRVWTAGCACGEETYSFAMLWDRFSGKLCDPPVMELFATDINVGALAKARIGVYGTSSLKELEPDMTARYFQPLGEAGRFIIDDSLRAQPRWMVLDLLVDEPPAQENHIVFLRNNLLTYYQDSLQRSVLRRIVSSIEDRGYLIVGSHEQIPASVEGLVKSGFNKSIFIRSIGARP